jgi:Transposase
MGNYAGVDWASEKHDVLICDEAGEELLAATFAHDEAGVGGLCRALQRANVELVAVERPDGVLIERLLDAGLRVLALHPNQVAAARPRFRASGGKSDRFDAFVLCELARTDHHRFRVLEPDTDATKALRAFTRAREDLVQARVALGNRLRGELERFWPGAIGLFSDLDSPISLAFLARYPSPIDARGLGEQRLSAFLDRHHYTGRKQPSDLLAKLKNAPEGRRRAGDQSLPRGRADARRLHRPAGRADQRAPAQDHPRDLRAPRRPDFPVAVSLRRFGDLRGDDALRDGRLSRSLPHPRRARRRRRPGRGRGGVRQAQGRALPLGMRQTAPRRIPHAR